jgi:SCP-2 sterol transfer family protein
LATKREVETRLRALIRRLAEADGQVQSSLADSLPEPKVVEICLSDLGTSYWSTLAAGSMDGLHAGTPTRADIRVRVDSDHLIELLDGKRSLFSSYVAGAVRIEASIADLLRLRRLA